MAIPARLAQPRCLCLLWKFASLGLKELLSQSKSSGFAAVLPSSLRHSAAGPGVRLSPLR